ncbi:hypothetical protein [Mycolicibacterium peregrinum]|uniref:hypothetical protein n=1 Tax=Mycolicibacterium peregrinum TaxID=43304 RepID=UPI003AAB2B37
MSRLVESQPLPDGTHEAGRHPRRISARVLRSAGTVTTSAGQFVAIAACIVLAAAPMSSTITKPFAVTLAACTIALVGALLVHLADRLAGRVTDGDGRRPSPKLLERRGRG